MQFDWKNVCAACYVYFHRIKQIVSEKGKPNFPSSTVNSILSHSRVINQVEFVKCFKGTIDIV